MFKGTNVQGSKPSNRVGGQSGATWWCLHMIGPWCLGFEENEIRFHAVTVGCCNTILVV